MVGPPVPGRKPNSQLQDKHVESIFAACLDEGSNPSSSTKVKDHRNFPGGLFFSPLKGKNLLFTLIIISLYIYIYNHTKTTKQTIMATQGQILDMTPLGMVFTVVKSKADTNGKSLDLEWELLPGCNMVDPLVHIHPEAIETYHVLEGEMEFFVKDKWVKAKKGDRLVVEKGISHTFRNPGDAVVKVYNTHEPALDMEDYFEDVVRVIDVASNNRAKSVSMKNLKTMLLFGALMRNYRREIIAVKPPDLLVRIMGGVARLFGVSYNQVSSE